MVQSKMKNQLILVALQHFISIFVTITHVCLGLLKHKNTMRTIAFYVLLKAWNVCFTLSSVFYNVCSILLVCYVWYIYVSQPGSFLGVFCREVKGAILGQK